MAKINSALGPISFDAIGGVMMHEHIMCVNRTMRLAFNDWINRNELLDRAVEMLVEAKETGIDTLVDMTPINLGRDVSVIKEASERSGVNIIVSTGFYHFDDPWLLDKDSEYLADKLVFEFENGIEDSGIKPAIIKCGSGNAGVTENNKKLLKIAALVHKKTGALISTHAHVGHWLGENVPEGIHKQQLDFFEDMGVDPSHVLIGHLGDTDDVDYIESFVKRGAYVGLDRFGTRIIPAENRIAVVVELIKRGYVHNLILSADSAACVDFRPPQFYKNVKNPWDLYKKTPVSEMTCKYSTVTKLVVPKLLEAGITQDEIDIMIKDNPRKLLSYSCF